MEDKENASGCTWNLNDTTVGTNVASPKLLMPPAVLKQISIVTNYNSDPTAVTSESSKTKTKGTPFSQTPLLKQNAKEKQLKTPVPNSAACLSERRALGSYRGKIVSSKINSFRKVIEHESIRHSLAGPPKSSGKVGGTNSNPATSDAKVTSTGCAPKPTHSTSQPKTTVRVSVSNPKPILSHEKQSARITSVDKAGAQRKIAKSTKPLPVPVAGNNSAQRAKKSLLPKNGMGNVLGPVSYPPRPMSASKPLDNRRTTMAKSEMRRTSLADWRALKGIKKPPVPVASDTRPETETVHENAKEQVESFWAAIVEEEEQDLVRDEVNKTLAQCLSLIEKDYPNDTVHSILKKLILEVPDAKKLAKYWVCQMRLEQCRSTEKVLGIYENAILAGAEPKGELRHALADVMKTTRNIPKPDEECLEKNTTQNNEAEINNKGVEKAFKELSFDKNVDSNNEETSQEATEASVNVEQEEFCAEKGCRNEHSWKPACPKKEEQSAEYAEEDEVLELKTPDNDKATSSYLIKYNLSTTPHLESTKKKLQGETNDSAVKDLKFLTPVRRSRRIQEKVFKLPDMLKDHNPCVSSLEQLGELGDDGTGFIYRQNSALQMSNLM